MCREGGGGGCTGRYPDNTQWGWMEDGGGGHTVWKMGRRGTQLASSATCQVSMCRLCWCASRFSSTTPRDLAFRLVPFQAHMPGASHPVLQEEEGGLGLPRPKCQKERFAGKKKRPKWLEMLMLKRRRRHQNC